MRKIPLILGILGMLLGILIAGVAFLLYATQDGRVSFDEAMLGVIPGAILAFLSFLLAVVGVIVVMMGRKQTPPA
jgi:hypothetical protein